MLGLATKIHRLYTSQQKQFHKTYYGNCAVLLYHRITDLSSDPQMLSVSPQNFEAQLVYLKKHHPVLRIDELKFHIEKKKKLPANSVAISFDDGYADNYLEALPLLESKELQAIFYIATATLNTEQEFWWDAIERILLLNENKAAEKEYILLKYAYDLTNLNRERRRRLYEKLLPVFRKLNSVERDKKINELATVFNNVIPRSTYRSLSFQELQQMNNSDSVVIGAHTHTHPSLGALSYNEQLQEIKTSKEILENLLQEKIVHFSFPFGTRADFNTDTISICKSLQFEMVAANHPYIVHKNTNIFQFPRFVVRNWDIDKFKNEARQLVKKYLLFNI